MQSQRLVTFVVPTYGTDEILKSSFLASPCLREPHAHQVLLQREYPSAAKAYNEAIDRADNDLMVFAHQDMVFPSTWLAELDKALVQLEATDPQWGVLGCCGVTSEAGVHVWVYDPTQGLLGHSFDHPEPIQTLDEIVLIFRKSSGLRFDENLPHFHLYGTDICLRAAKMGMNSYAISAFCVHNGPYHLSLPKEYYECYRYVRKKWKEALPIYTSCGPITALQFPMYKRRLREVYMKYVTRQTVPTARYKDAGELLQQAEIACNGFK